MAEPLYKPEELKVSSWSSARRSSWVFESISGVRVIHLPTGICIEEEGARSQHRNRANALRRLNEELATRSSDRGEAPARADSHGAGE